jgi:hypothetical protein
MTVKVAVTGANVPGVNAGMFITAFVNFTTLNTCNPVPELTESTVYFIQ